MRIKILVGVLVVFIAIGSFYAGALYAVKVAAPLSAPVVQNMYVPAPAPVPNTGKVLDISSLGFTLQFRDGTTHAVSFTASTTVFKLPAPQKAKVSDIVVGAQLTVIGATVQDGSIEAQQVQLFSAAK